MSTADEDYVSPADVSLPQDSFEVVQEMYQPPSASLESIKASENPQNLNTPPPSYDQTGKG